MNGLHRQLLDTISLPISGARRRHRGVFGGADIFSWVSRPLRPLLVPLLPGADG